MRTTIKIGIALSVVVVAAVYALSRIPASFVCALETTYVTAPESDDELKSWVIAQPNVVAHTVHINRRDNQKLEVVAIVTHDSWNHRPFRDINDQCNELGYELASPFKNSN
ncbi:hypothetical protein N9Y42_03930 [Mariniblastus sp.]|nr:hypothetical protein [Mariniblastus sp.]